MRRVLVRGFFALLLVRSAPLVVPVVGDASSGRLIYDADCGFCTRSATWLARRRPSRVALVPWQSVPDLAALGLTERDVSERVYWQDGSGGGLQPAHEAIAAALVARGGPSVAMGRLIVSPLLAPLSGVVYRWVAAHRHAMPGSTAACAMPAPSRSADD